MALLLAGMLGAAGHITVDRGTKRRMHGTGQSDAAHLAAAPDPTGHHVFTHVVGPLPAAGATEGGELSAGAPPA